MNAVGNRHWLRFSLRRMFVVVTLLACWLAYHVNWIRARHAARTWIEDHPPPSPGPGLNNGFLLTIMDERSLSWSLRILGEKPENVILIGTDEVSVDHRRHVKEITALFPEAYVSDMAIPATTVQPKE